MVKAKAKLNQNATKRAKAIVLTIRDAIPGFDNSHCVCYIVTKISARILTATQQNKIPIRDA